jgi:hypothetical protein
MSDARIPDEVIEEAEAAADGELYDRGFGSPDGPLPAMGPFIRNMAARFVVEAAAPIIARHAAQAERDRIEARIEKNLEATEGQRNTDPNFFPADHPYMRGFRAATRAALSAINEKEGPE